MAARGTSQQGYACGIDLKFACVALDEEHGVLHVFELYRELKFRSVTIVDSAHDVSPRSHVAGEIGIVFRFAALPRSSVDHHNGRVQAGFRWIVDDQMEHSTANRILDVRARTDGPNACIRT